MARRGRTRRREALEDDIQKLLDAEVVSLECIAMKHGVHIHTVKRQRLQMIIKQTRVLEETK